MPETTETLTDQADRANIARRAEDITKAITALLDDMADSNISLSANDYDSLITARIRASVLSSTISVTR